MITNRVSIIRPYMPEFLDKIVLLVLPHFLQQIYLGHPQLLKNILKSDDSHFGLKKVSPVKTIKTVNPQHRLLLALHPMQKRIIAIIAKIGLDRP